jgi:hypothetical protein
MFRKEETETIIGTTESTTIVTGETMMETMITTIMGTTGVATTMQEDKSKIPLWRDFLFFNI